VSGTLPQPAGRIGGLALGGTGIAATLALLPDLHLVPVFVAALVLGAAFVALDYGFTGGFRALLIEGDGRMLGATFIVPGVAALIVIPVAGFVEGYGRLIAPIGPPLVLGAMVFGIGMQLANGCGSGTLVAAGQGSRRMMVALPFFCLGGVIGSLLLPPALRLPGLGEGDLVRWFGPWPALAAMLALLLAFALVILRGARPRRESLRAGAIIGALAGVLLLASGMPWGVTMGLTLWGAKAVQALGVDLGGFPFWAHDWTREALAGPLLALHSSLSDVGLLLGALVAAAALGRLRHGVRIGLRGALGAALGGLLMGVGARLSFGCNVGAFLGGASSGSLHGLVWIAAAIPGCWIGIRMRPWFGLSGAEPGR
jgi:hypothetical protein